MTTKDVCSKGHPWTEANTIRRSDGSRRCRECTQVYERGYKKSSPTASVYSNPVYRANRLTVIRDSVPYCAICGGYVDKGLSGKHAYGPSVDHVLPVSHGGTHDLHNLALVHSICNSRKRNVITNTNDKPVGTRRW